MSWWRCASTRTTRRSRRVLGRRARPGGRRRRVGRRAAAARRRAGFRIRFVPTEEPKVGPEPDALRPRPARTAGPAATVARALELGARATSTSASSPEEEHVVLADPEGNEFCVIEPGNGFLAGTAAASAACRATARRRVGHFWSEALGWPLVWDQDEETAIQSPRGGTKISWGGPPLHAQAGTERLALAPRSPAGRRPAGGGRAPAGAGREPARRAADGPTARWCSPTPTATSSACFPPGQRAEHRRPGGRGRHRHPRSVLFGADEPAYREVRGAPGTKRAAARLRRLPGRGGGRSRPPGLRRRGGRRRQVDLHRAGDR